VTASQRLGLILASESLTFLMEAHSGVSAHIVEEAGFEAIWASGLTIATSLGVRDCNEASWTQVLEVVESMADVTSIPILVDGDSGYGNFNNVRRLVRKLCERGVAGVCLEDKLFPKANSFLGERQPLVDVAEFCGKIRAARDSQTDEEFCVVARVEALVSGLGLGEALRRAHAYREAGASAILIHSKRRSPDEVLAFGREWAGRCPLIVVPTTYPSVTREQLEQAGVSAVIWANHTLRAAIAAMRRVCREIHRRRSTADLESNLASVGDVLSMFDHDELRDAEARYLAPTPPSRAPAKVESAAAHAGLARARAPHA
jgi:phosphoenolpyruvate phosphomutase